MASWKKGRVKNDTRTGQAMKEKSSRLSAGIGISEAETMLTKNVIKFHCGNRKRDLSLMRR